MAEFPALPLWTDAYLGDTTHLTTIEHGAYLLLLMAMWRNDGFLPDDDRKLARYAKLNLGQWARVSETLRPFFRAENGRLTQGRLTDELNLVKRNSMKQSNNSRARWLKTKDTGDAVGMPNASHGNAPTTTPTTTPKKEIRIVEPEPELALESEAPKVTASDHFDAFWEAYPKKTAKPAAKAAFSKFVKEGESPERIVEGAKRYAHWLNSGKPGEFRPHVKYPQGWLNERRWEDPDLWVEDEPVNRYREILARAQAAVRG